MLRKLGWDGDLTADELAAIKKVAGTEDDMEKLDKVNWKVDLSGGIQRVAIKHGCAPFGNAKARTVVWTFPDPVPLHREPLYTNAPRPAGQVRHLRGPVHAPASDPLCVDPEDRLLQGLPDHLTSGRLVEYEGGGDETRSNPWLAELQQDMFVEINPRECQQPWHQGRRHGLGGRSGRPRSRSWPW
jgi:formate dehydrogenase major subunit